MKEKPLIKSSFSPQYFIISKSEPAFELIRKQLLDSSRLPAGSSHYFIRAEQDRICLCRIRTGNGSVLFYEVLDHLRKGISDEEMWYALSDPANVCPLPGYFYVTPKMDEKLREAA